MEELTDGSYERVQTISKILYEHWDPLGVRSLGAPADEYEHYAKSIVQHYQYDTSKADLVQYLTESAKIRMKIRCSSKKTSLVADAILKALGPGPS